MGQFVDQKIYRTFEEFEREELRRDGYFESVDSMIDDMFAGELDFEPACLEFYKTERAVNSASSEQVRRPIYREGLDQWRHYEPWLGPLKEALGPLASERTALD